MFTKGNLSDLEVSYIIRIFQTLYVPKIQIKILKDLFKPYQKNLEYTVYLLWKLYNEMCAFSYNIIDDQLALCFLMLIVSYAFDVIWKQEVSFDIMK